ncbi:VP1054 [Lonomia obliqua multiple nucleopolyhedrovirus]|uniref:VP1054 n=1 Tax=Lonomia obliqua multiple nucleopolyhedrovirus TaxID=134394 RepID=A0A126FCD8_9ABAC|nr:VP1054 [Lonomia obliqua multiple nucleopolyhedrovirus]AKN81057.1 VP1054 [Lonomia obliqua multiple nucleopolyhedrovirus]
MSLTKKPIKLNLCASVKLVPYKPMRVPKQMQCWMHPRRANCKVMRLRNNYSDPDNENDMLHLTVLNSIFLDQNAIPYYRTLLRKSTDQAESRKTIINADNIYECLLIRPIRTERFKSIDEAGESNMAILKILIKTAMNYLGKLCTNEYILIVDRLCLDMVYSEFRAIILPQRAYVLQGEDAGDSSSSSNNVNRLDRIKFPWNQISSINLIASTDESRQSQYIYQTFLLYNTILTAILKQTNPFDVISENTSISIIIRNLGSCPNNKDRIKCCDLNYGGIPPGHVMCPPREITKRVFHYAKWARNPNNYKRYNEIIARQFNMSNRTPNNCLRRNLANDLNARDRSQLYLLDWQNFMGEFSSYFGLPVQ